MNIYRSYLFGMQRKSMPPAYRLSKYNRIELLGEIAESAVFGARQVAKWHNSEQKKDLMHSSHLLLLIARKKEKHPLA